MRIGVCFVLTLFVCLFVWPFFFDHFPLAYFYYYYYYYYFHFLLSSLLLQARTDFFFCFSCHDAIRVMSVSAAKNNPFDEGRKEGRKEGGEEERTLRRSWKAIGRIVLITEVP